MRTFALMRQSDKTLSYVRHFAKQITRHAHGIKSNTRHFFSLTDQSIGSIDQPILSISERCLHISLLE
jgi:hypothetical protein